MRPLAAIGACAVVVAFAACGGSDGDIGQATGSAAPETPVEQGLKMSKQEIASLPKLSFPTLAGPAPKKLRVVDLRQGSGVRVKPHDLIFVKYLNNSYAEARAGAQPGRFGPFWFEVGDELIEEWQRGLPGMRVGGRRMLIVPSGSTYSKARVFVFDLLAVERG
jgi:peptidylprolyl isomerase